MRHPTTTHRRGGGEDRIEANTIADRLIPRIGKAVHVIVNVESGHLPPSTLDVAGLGHLADHIDLGELALPHPELFRVIATNVTLINRLVAAWACIVSDGIRSMALAGTARIATDGTWRIVSVLHSRLITDTPVELPLSAAVASGQLALSGAQR